MAKVFSQPNISVEKFSGSLVKTPELTEGIIRSYRSNVDHQDCSGYEAFRRIFNDACAYLQKSGLYQSNNAADIIDYLDLPQPSTPFKLAVPLVCGPESLDLMEMPAHNVEVGRLDDHLAERYLGLRRFAIGIVTAGPCLSLCYFDHTRYLKTKPFNAFQEQGLFLRVVATIDRLCNKDLGREEFIIAADPNPSEPSFVLRLPSNLTRNQHGDFIQSDVELRLTALSSRHYIKHWPPMLGRGTVGLSVLEPAYDTTHDWLAVFAWYSPKEINGLRVLSKSMHCDQHFYPEIQYALTATVKLPTESMAIQDALTDRDLHILVYRIPKDLRELDYIKTSRDFRSVFVDLVRRHREAYETAGVLHKCINAKYPGFYPYGENLIGFLNKWSLSGKENSKREGAAHFFAIDLLNDPSPWHKYRHDLESFFYLLLWFIADKQDNGNNSFFDKMPCDTLDGEQDWKLDFLKNDPAKMKEILVEKLAPEFFGIVDDWILPLAKLLREAYNGFEKDETGEELRDKQITYDNFMKILEGGSASAQSG